MPGGPNTTEAGDLKVAFCTNRLRDDELPIVNVRSGSNAGWHCRQGAVALRLWHDFRCRTRSSPTRFNATSLWFAYPSTERYL